jgi:hypothetical protein
VTLDLLNRQRAAVVSLAQGARLPLLLILAATLAGCASQPAARPDPTPLFVYVYVTPEPSTGTTPPDPTSYTIFGTPAPTSQPTPGPTPTLTPRPTPKPIVLPSLTVFYAKPKPTPKPITFTVPAMGDPGGFLWKWSPYFTLSGEPFTVHWTQINRYTCWTPDGWLLRKGAAYPDNLQAGWTGDYLSCRADSVSWDMQGNRLQVAAGTYRMEVSLSYNPITFTITQP